VKEAAASKVLKPLIRQTCPFRKVQEIKDLIMGTESGGSQLDGWPSIVTGKCIDAKCQLMRHSSLGHFLALQPIIIPFPSTVLTCAVSVLTWFFLQRLLQAVVSKLSLSPLHLISQPKSISKVSGMPVDIHPLRPSLPSLTGDCDSLNRPSGEFRRSAEGWMRVPILPRVSPDEGMHYWRGMQVAPDSKKGAKAR
jgi:hypothetical protein